MLPVTRYDTGRLSRAKPGPAGSRLVPAAVTRSGVYAYHLPDGSVQHELRPADEVFSEDSLASLQHAPVTDLHPPTPVTPENWSEFSIGSVVSKPHVDGRWVHTNLQINDAASLANIDNDNRTETSCGYTCVNDNTPGITSDGERYDSIQRTIRYNHVAIGPTGWARAGREASLKLDAGVQTTKNQTEVTTVKFTIDGIHYDTTKDPAAAEQAFAKNETRWQDRLDAKDAKLKVQQNESTELKKVNDGLKKKLDAKPDIPALVKKRVALVSKIKLLVPKLDGVDTMSDRDLMIEGIKSVKKDFEAKDLSDDNIAGMIDMVEPKEKSDSESGHRKLRNVGSENPQSEPKQDDKPFVPAWKQPMAISSNR